MCLQAVWSLKLICRTKNSEIKTQQIHDKKKIEYNIIQRQIGQKKWNENPEIKNEQVLHLDFQSSSFCSLNFDN